MYFWTQDTSFAPHWRLVQIHYSNSEVSEKMRLSDVKEMENVQLDSISKSIGINL